jgi:hypothetical protein
LPYNVTPVENLPSFSDNYPDVENEFLEYLTEGGGY